MNVSIKQLQAFVAVAKSQSFAEACTLVHLSQPALSISIKNLEEAVGGKLLARSTRSVALTPEGAEFLRIISWNFVAMGIVFTCSGMFQALGNTVPALLASATRLATFVIPAVWLSGQSWFELRHLWWVSVATLALQAVIAWWLLSGESSCLVVLSGDVWETRLSAWLHTA